MSKNMFLGLAIAAAMAGPFGVSSMAACGGNYPRMQIGVLPDIFLPQSPGAAGKVVRTWSHYWSANSAMPPKGDCNIYARSSISSAELATTYAAAGCPSPPGGLIEACERFSYPRFAQVGPAIGDDAVRKWPMLVAIDAAGTRTQIGGIMMLGADCSGDICELPQCIRGGADEFPAGPDRCRYFDPAYEGWVPGEEGFANMYLMGRGNVYVGPRVQPAFRVTAPGGTREVRIDHWIANGNPNARIFVTPLTGLGDRREDFYGVRYDTAANVWFIATQRDGVLIPEKASFNVYVMGDGGPGLRVSSTGSSSEIVIDDHILNENPNAVILATPIITQNCTLPPDGRGTGGGSMMGPAAPVCAPAYYNKPHSVAYDARRKRWLIKAGGGGVFQSNHFNVFAAGLPGGYRKFAWSAGVSPDYDKRLQPVAVRSPLPPRRPAVPAVPDPLGLDVGRAKSTIVLISHNGNSAYAKRRFATESNLSVGVYLADDGWRIHSLNGTPLPDTLYNVLVPLPAL